MSDNNEERREDRNRKMSLEDKSILQERIDLFEKSLANTGIGLKLTREELTHIIKSNPAEFLKLLMEMERFSQEMIKRGRGITR
ncbi:MAG: hypothetical protein QN755_04100 [Nitrososphaeraceae archaeon]|nr:hypothetical protein [Nitrososphaeraceae archaeon]MDW0334872.1 hypothetical protein [Nitrososphaeraceae archaeon]